MGDSSQKKPSPTKKQRGNSNRPSSKIPGGSQLSANAPAFNLQKNETDTSAHTGAVDQADTQLPPTDSSSPSNSSIGNLHESKTSLGSFEQVSKPDDEVPITMGHCHRTTRHCSCCDVIIKLSSRSS